MTLKSGSHLGPYEILEPIGTGGMGQVYRARDPSLERDVAVKLLPEGAVVGPARLARFALGRVSRRMGLLHLLRRHLLQHRVQLTHDAREPLPLTGRCGDASDKLAESR